MLKQKGELNEWQSKNIRNRSPLGFHGWSYRASDCRIHYSLADGGAACFDQREVGGFRVCRCRVDVGSSERLGIRVGQQKQVRETNSHILSLAFGFLLIRLSLFSQSKQAVVLLDSVAEKAFIRFAASPYLDFFIVQRFRCIVQLICVF